MTAPVLQAPPLTEEEAVTHGWKVFRSAQRAVLPPEHQREIGRAVTNLWTELDMHGRLADDAWASEAAPLTRARFAENALNRAADLTGLIEKYCTAQAGQREGEGS